MASENPRTKGEQAESRKQQGAGGPPRQLVSAVMRRYPGVIGGLSTNRAWEAKQHSKRWVLQEIECIYDERYQHEAAELERRKASMSTSEREVSEGYQPMPFAEFLRYRQKGRYGVPHIVETKLWELMCNAESARREGRHESIGIFCAFAGGAYDVECLDFFLFCRQACLFELAKGRSSPIRAADCLPNATLNRRQCFIVLKMAFQGNEGPLSQALRSVVGAQLRNNGDSIPAYTFLKTLLAAFFDAGSNRHLQEEALSHPHLRHVEANQSGVQEIHSAARSPLTPANELDDDLPEHHSHARHHDIEEEEEEGGRVQSTEQVLSQLRNQLIRVCRDYSLGARAGGDVGKTESAVFRAASSELASVIVRALALRYVEDSDESLEAEVLCAVRKCEQGHDLSSYEAYSICRRVLCSQRVRDTLMEYLASKVDLKGGDHGNTGTSTAST